MKLLIISDSHGNIANLKHVMGFAKKVKVGAVIHCGDWDNVESVETVLSFGIPLYSVLGNADIDPGLGKRLKVKSKRFAEGYLEFKLGRKKIGIIHDINILPDVDILFCGHTHQRFEEIVDGVRIVNPGALENRINFAVYNAVGTHETANNRVEFFDDGQT